MGLTESYGDIHKRIAEISKAPVTLIAVSKLQPIEKIQELYTLGHRDFGENYVQELVEKAEKLRLKCPEIRWHFIGHLQRNKVKLLLPVVTSIHSVSSIALAQEISKRWLALNLSSSLAVFLEVNIDREETKAGFLPDVVVDAASDIAKIPGLSLRGLMAIPAKSADSAAFQRLKALEKKCQPLTKGELSMGMSGDFEEAISQGATHVRIGTSLFGERPQ